MVYIVIKDTQITIAIIIGRVYLYSGFKAFTGLFIVHQYIFINYSQIVICLDIPRIVAKSFLIAFNGVRIILVIIIIKTIIICQLCHCRIIRRWSIWLISHKFVPQLLHTEADILLFYFAVGPGIFMLQFIHFPYQTVTLLPLSTAFLDRLNRGMLKVVGVYHRNKMAIIHGTISSGWTGKLWQSLNFYYAGSIAM